jgi:hypothetical protein
MVRGRELEEIAKNTSREARIEEGRPGNVRQHIVDPTENRGSSITMSNPCVAVMVSDGEVRERRHQPLPHSVVRGLSVQVVEVEPAVTWHAQVEVGQQEGGVEITICRG